MRCLSVADALAAQGADVEFVLSDDGPAGIIESRGYGTHSLGTDWRDITQGIDGLLVLCKSEEAPVVLVDTYSISKEFVSLAAPYAKVCYLGSKGGDFGELSLIANYSTDIDEEFYKATYGRRGTKLLMGAAYAPLRPCFTEAYRRRNGEISRVLLTTGNTDPEGFMSSFLRTALSDDALSGVYFSAVLGRMAPKSVAAEVEQICSAEPRVEALYGVSDMAGLMARCDAAVSANGTTVYEFAAAGVPAVTFAMVEEQVRSAESLSNLGAVEYCGLMGRDAAEVSAKCGQALTELVVNPGRAAILADRAHDLVDGRGAEKIAKEILSL